MKKKIFKFIPWILIAAMFIVLIPGLMLRLENESKNKNIVMSVLFNDLNNKVSDNSVDGILKEYLDAGITTASVMEEDLNMLVARGDVTCIKYNVLRHKYEDENIILADEIAKVCPDVTFDSYIILVKRDEMIEKFKRHINARYTNEDCFYAGNIQNMDVYIFFDGKKELWDYSISYNEESIIKLKELGFEVSLIHKVKDYKTTDYIDYIDELVKKYDIKYLNLKEDAAAKKNNTAVINSANYEGLAKIINENDMTLVVTENTDQLSNEKFIGYEYVFKSVMKDDGGTSKVMRSYETYDDSHATSDGYKHRVSQHFNSTVDRNIRFITVTQITDTKKDFYSLSKLTLKAAEEYIEKIEAQGFTVGGETQKLDYFANGKLNYAACCVIMVMAVLLMLRAVFGKDFEMLTVFAIIISVIGFAATYLLYEPLYALISLYPTVFCLIVSCFAMTMVLLFLKNFKDRIKLLPLTLSTLLIMLISLFLGTVGMSTLLSGIDYYVNNEIFRGIKLSLLVPVAYTAVVFCIMFIKLDSNSLFRKIPAFLNSQIRVYWVILAGIILCIGAYYIIRSGNVNSISAFETLVRNKLTEMFSARPRTKEFLIGYPALLLLVYYVKKINIKLLQWLLAIAASILAASVTNSFCHVFTDYTVIVSRTLNGLIVGMFVSVFAIIANLILVKVVTALNKKFTSVMENNNG